jgi:NAD(P)-dependent dehydrogenase (short-subunit alcohol dehydrogenase family)
MLARDDERRARVWTDPDGMVAGLASAQGRRPRGARGVTGRRARGRDPGALASPEEIARLIAFAASPDNITGK